ncbi:hypothetical protein Q7P37_002397 [Cladosporium fusiforme]
MSGPNTSGNLTQKFGELQVDGDHNIIYQGVYSALERVETGHFIVPRSINRLFTGRSDVLQRLKSSIGSGKEPSKDTDRQKRIVITGIGGVGKSEVCLKLVEEVRERFDNVFWVDVRAQRAAEAGFMHLSSSLGLQAKTPRAVIDFLGGTKHTWLLVLDNADQIREDFSRYFPPGSRGTVIMTSRNPECGESYGYTHWERLDVLSSSHSTNLLLQAAGLESLSLHRTAAEEVTKLLGCHNLAVILAGSYVRKGYCDLNSYPDIYHKYWERTVKHADSQEQSRYDSVLATFEASMAHLENDSDQATSDAHQILHTLSALAASNVPVTLFEEAGHKIDNVPRCPHLGEADPFSRWHASKLPDFVPSSAGERDRHRLRAAYNTLKSLSLLTVSGSGSTCTLTLHPLIHEWVWNRQSSQQIDSSWFMAVVFLSIAAINAEADDRHSFANKHHTHFANFVDKWLQDLVAPTMDHSMLRILSLCSRILYHSRSDVLAANCLRKLAKLSLGKGQMPVTKCFFFMRLWAMTLLMNGDTLEGVILMEQFLITHESPSLAGVYWLNKMLDVIMDGYLLLQQYRSAIALSEHMKDTPIPSDHGHFPSVEEVTDATKQLQAYTEKARSILKRSIEVREGTLEEEPARYEDLKVLIDEVASATGNTWGQGRSLSEVDFDTASLEVIKLAACLKHLQGKFHEALPLLERSLCIQEDQLGRNSIHEDLLDSKISLAIGYLDCPGDIGDQSKKAIALLEDVVKIREGRLAEHRSTLLSSQHHLAAAYTDSDIASEGERAITLLEHVVKVREQSLPNTHRDLISSQLALVQAYAFHGGQEQYDTALGLLKHLAQTPRGRKQCHREVQRGFLLISTKKGQFEAAMEAYSASIHRYFSGQMSHDQRRFQMWLASKIEARAANHATTGEYEEAMRLLDVLIDAHRKVGEAKEAERQQTNRDLCQKGMLRVTELENQAQAGGAQWRNGHFGSDDE